MGNETTAITTVTDDSGYQYDLMVLPDQNAPLIKEASQEILQEMSINSIIQNLENVAKLMFIAYNALAGTLVQSKMSGMQKNYLDLMDESGQAITAFKRESKDICVLIAKAYDWLLKGKEGMAVTQFNKCAQAAADMAQRAERLADGFKKLSDEAEEVLEKTQDESALQYQKMDELKAQMEQYNANLKKCESLRDSLKTDIDSINQIYKDAKKKEDSIFDLKKGIMVTQIVMSCIATIIPTGKSMQDSSDQAGNSKAADDAQQSLDEQKKQQQSLEAEKKTQQETLDGLNQKKAALEKEIQEIQQKIEIEKGVTAHTEEEHKKILDGYNADLEKKNEELSDVNTQISASEKEISSTQSTLDSVKSSIDNLNKQLTAFQEQCKNDLERAEEATRKALDTKLKLEEERRNTLASIQEFTGLIQASVQQKNTAETAVQTLGVAIRCIKQVVVALVTAAKFWRSMEEYCQSLSDSGLGKEIKELSEGLSMEERQEYYHDRDFMITLLIYICRWAALYYVCDDYKTRSEKVRNMVAENMQESHSREEEWKLAESKAQEMAINIGEQVKDSQKVIESLKK